MTGASQFEVRPFLPAVVGPRAARAIDRHMGPALDRLAQGLMASPIVANREHGVELQLALKSLRESARQWDERTGHGSDRGTAEPVVVVEGAQSSQPPGHRLTVGQVAERTGLSPEFIRRICDAGILSATQPGGRGTPWLIDETSANDYKARRQI